MLSPILVFTADEIWENLPAGNARPASVHMALLPEERGEVDAKGDAAFVGNWHTLFEIRDTVLHSLEEARIAKEIGSSLEARVEITATGETHDLLLRYVDQLRYIFIVSQVNLVRSENGAALAVKVLPAEGRKCERCWNYSTRVGESTRYPDVCERCSAALEEIERKPAN